MRRGWHLLSSCLPATHSHVQVRRSCGVAELGTHASDPLGPSRPLCLQSWLLGKSELRMGSTPCDVFETGLVGAFKSPDGLVPGNYVGGLL